MKRRRIVVNGLPVVGAGDSCEPLFCGKDGNTVQKLLGVVVLCVACMIGLGSVGCSKKNNTSGKTSANSTSTETEKTSANATSTEVEKTTTKVEKTDVPAKTTVTKVEKTVEKTEKTTKKSSD